MDDMHLIATRRLQCEIQCVSHILRTHVRAELPRDDVTAVIIQDGTEIEPAPTQYLDVSEVGLPKLVDPSCLVFELIGCLDDDERRAGDQIVGLQHALHCRF